MREHAHPSSSLCRALLVGSVHGVGGSALLGIIAAKGTDAGQAIAYAGVFGTGATLGMLVLSTVVSFPLRWPRVRAAALGRLSRTAIGVASIAVGVWMGGHSLLRIAPLVS